MNVRAAVLGTLFTIGLLTALIQYRDYRVSQPVPQPEPVKEEAEAGDETAAVDPEEEQPEAGSEEDGEGDAESRIDPPPEIPKEPPFAKAVVDEMEHTFEPMSVGEEGRHTFVVHNKGEAPLKLARGKTTCKCTLSELAKQEIPPGGSAEITLVWEPRALNPEFVQRAHIHTNDPENPELRLVVQGRVEQEVVFPDSLTLGEVSDTGPVTVTGTIHSAVHDDLKVTSATCENEFIDCTLEPLSAEELQKLQAKSGARLTVTARPGIKTIGQFREKIQLQTSLDGGTELVSFLVGSRSGPIRIIPNAGTKWYAEAMAIDLGTFEAAKGKTAELSLFVTGLDEELQLVEQETTLNFLKVTLTPDPSFEGKQRRRYTLKFEVPPGSPPVTKLRKESVKVYLTT
ncbi:MAG: DUF1573 domain-containing protein, partial [Planctomycetaceae bacterium]|nr:DUF1573 domain-containing protein [Planctomycetaceae bacterium]